MGAQGGAGDEEKDAFAASGDLPGDMQGGKGFAGTAGHDEFAACFIACVAARHVAQGFSLMRAQFFVFARRGLPALVMRPVNLARFQVAQGDGADDGLLVVQRSGDVVFALNGVICAIVGGVVRRGRGRGIAARSGSRPASGAQRQSPGRGRSGFRRGNG